MKGYCKICEKKIKKGKGIIIIDKGIKILYHKICFLNLNKKK